MTVTGPWGISSLGGVNSFSGPVATARGSQHARRHRVVCPWEVPGDNSPGPAGIGRRFPGRWGPPRRPKDGPPGFVHDDRDGQDRFFGRDHADEQGVKFAVGIGPADQFLGGAGLAGYGEARRSRLLGGAARWVTVAIIPSISLAVCWERTRRTGLGGNSLTIFPWGLTTSLTNGTA